MLPHITIVGGEIMRVETCTLLVVELNTSLTWHNHIEKGHRKASTRQYFTSQLCRTKTEVADMVTYTHPW